MEITCINCPVGCRMEVDLEDGKVTAVGSHAELIKGCPEYAKMVGADFYAKDATETARIAAGVLGSGLLSRSTGYPGQRIADKGLPSIHIRHPNVYRPARVTQSITNV